MKESSLKKVNVVCRKFDFKNKKIKGTFMGHPKVGYIYNAFIDPKTKNLRVVLPAQIPGMSGIMFDEPSGSNEDYSFEFGFYGGLNLMYVDLESYKLNTPELLKEWEESKEEEEEPSHSPYSGLPILDSEENTITADEMVDDFELFINYAESLISSIQPRSREISQGLIYLLEDIDEVLLEGLETPPTEAETIEMIQEMLNELREGKKRVDFRYLQMLFVYLSFQKNKGS